MRELCVGKGAAVAAAVAFLEKQANSNPEDKKQDVEDKSEKKRARHKIFKTIEKFDKNEQKRDKDEPKSEFNKSDVEATRAPFPRGANDKGEVATIVLNSKSEKSDSGVLCENPKNGFPKTKSKCNTNNNNSLKNLGTDVTVLSNNTEILGTKSKSLSTSVSPTIKLDVISANNKVAKIPSIHAESANAEILGTNTEGLGAKTKYFDTNASRNVNADVTKNVEIHNKIAKILGTNLDGVVTNLDSLATNSKILKTYSSTTTNDMPKISNQNSDILKPDLDANSKNLGTTSKIFDSHSQSSSTSNVFNIDAIDLPTNCNDVPNFNACERLDHNCQNIRDPNCQNSRVSEFQSESVAKDEEDADFDVAVRNFDLTAEDVQKFVVETMRNIESQRIDGSSDASSSPEDDETVKGEKWGNGSIQSGSSSDISTSSSERPGKSLKDRSTRCNGDFQWICKDKRMEDPIPHSKPPINRHVRDRTPRKSEKTAPGSLDRRRHHQHQNRQDRDQKSRSSHVLKSPPRLEDYVGCQNWCCNPHAGDFFENFHRRHERCDPQRYGSNPMLIDRFLERGSHPDLYNDRIRHDGTACACAYHLPPPPFYYYGDPRGYHWTPTKPPDQDERVRKLQSERDNLQLQVQVLGEQIEAQNEKIGDLEKTLNEKKQLLINAEDLLQREMLSRSSLETQKLELMSAISELKLQHASLERENLELRTTQYNNNSNGSLDGIKKPPYLPRMTPQPTLTSTPVHGSNQALRKSPSPSPVTVGSASPRRIDTNSQDLQSPKTPPATYRRQIELQYASLPRQQFLSNGGSSLSVVDSNANPANGVRKGVAFGMGLSSLLGVRARGQSVPNLAETEKIVIEDGVNETPQSPSLQFNKNKGIKKILGKIKRSNSGNLDDFSNCGDFQRGGIRATASARLGWSEPNPTPKPDKPFTEWDTENICDWLQDLGLDQYVPEAKRWVKSGQQLLETNINEIEKELGVKNLLHRKKLQLALIDTEENSSSDPFLSKAGKLDTAWVLRWLDDTGLPQHKENFLLNRIDGRVLHRLTMDDLALLHVTSLLHVASIKRGIQVLRENNYEPGCLQRRSLPDDLDHPTPKQISLWSTHRVMEWLRAVDLAEYAPNLRGAGVHGGLMVLENKFTAELLASLLSIPPGKTLLRRHLNTHFKELLGKDTIQAKREAEATLGYIPLTPASKLKVAKKSHFSLKRNKSKSEADYGDLVCPLNQNSGENYQNGSPFNNSMGMMKRSARDEVAYHLAEEDSTSGSSSNSPLLQRHE